MDIDAGTPSKDDVTCPESPPEGDAGHERAVAVADEDESVGSVALEPPFGEVAFHLARPVLGRVVETDLLEVGSVVAEVGDRRRTIRIRYHGAPLPDSFGVPHPRRRPHTVTIPTYRVTGSRLLTKTWHGDHDLVGSDHVAEYLDEPIAARCFLEAEELPTRGSEPAEVVSLIVAAVTSFPVGMLEHVVPGSVVCLGEPRIGEQVREDPGALGAVPSDCRDLGEDSSGPNFIRDKDGRASGR